MKQFLKGAATLAAGGLVAKAVGALYRILLVGRLGGYGMGLYQMAYPFFVLLLTFSSAGIPSAFSRVVARSVARGGNGREELFAALKTFALLGLAGSLFMCLLAPSVGRLQGEEELSLCYYALAPAVFLIALIAVFRGYFQGKSNMLPTASSEVVEQLVKTGLGVYFATAYSGEPVRAVALCLAAVTLSELTALCYLILLCRREPVRPSLPRGRVGGGELLFSALPVMAATSLLPLSQTVDSVVIVRLLSRYSARSVSLYGLFTGGAVALVNLPASLCYGLASASIPALSSAAAEREEERKRRALSFLAITLALALPAALFLYLFAKPIVNILYPALPGEDGALLISLIRLSSVSAATLAGVDTLAACLTGMGRAKAAAGSMLVAVLVKSALQWLLVSKPAFSVGGAAIASNACYLVAFFLDLYYTLRRTPRREKQHDNGNRIGRRERRYHSRRHSEDEGGGRGARTHGAPSLGRGREGSGHSL